MSAYDKHKRLMRSYLQHKQEGGGGLPAGPETDMDILVRHNQFIRDEEADAKSSSWEVRMALKYYQRLCKEYAICDLSRHRDGAVGLRWRTEGEVLGGKGQWECGARGCDARDDLHSYEVNFAFVDTATREARNELVKVRLCADCAQKLYYRKLKELRRRARKARKREGRAAAAGAGAAAAALGHELVRQALAREPGDTEDGGGKGRTGGGSGGSGGGSGGSGGGSGSGGSGAKRSGDGPAEGEAGRKEKRSRSGVIEADASEVWSRPLEPERTARDDMDDFFSGLFV